MKLRYWSSVSDLQHLYLESKPGMEGYEHSCIDEGTPHPSLGQMLFKTNKFLKRNPLAHLATTVSPTMLGTWRGVVAAKKVHQVRSDPIS